MFIYWGCNESCKLFVDRMGMFVIYLFNDTYVLGCDIESDG
jgi:hypothetical protein